METLKAIFLILMFCLFFYIGWQIVSFYLAGEILKSIFWLLILLLFSANGKTRYK